MKVAASLRLALLYALLVACFPASKDESRAGVAGALRDSLGEAAQPRVAFQKDSTHLLVQLATVAFPTQSDSAWTDQARRIASLALRNYGKSDRLDSLTIQYTEQVRPGAWWVRHTNTFSAADLRSVR